MNNNQNNAPDNLNNMMQVNMNTEQQPVNNNVETTPTQVPETPTEVSPVENQNRDDFVSSVLADAYMGQENASQGAVNMEANANTDYIAAEAENNNSNIGPTDHLTAPEYVNDPEVLENIENAIKGTLPVSKELKLIIIISIIMLLFIFGFDTVYELIRNIRYS